jgi:hypothetical protein
MGVIFFMRKRFYLIDDSDKIYSFYNVKNGANETKIY